MYANIRSQHKNLSFLSHIARGGVFSEVLVSARRQISEVTVPGFGKPMHAQGSGLIDFEGWLYACVMVFCI